jgi:hypothetical protein
VADDAVVPGQRAVILHAGERHLLIDRLKDNPAHAPRLVRRA